MRRAFIYCRISDDREGRELGVGRQEEDLRALAKRLALPVAGVYIDNDRGASTRSSKPRPEYKRLLADAAGAKGGAAVLAYTSGRLTRRPRENEDLIDLAISHGVEFRYERSPSFDLNSAAGRRIARTLAAQDAGESEDIAERVARASLQRAEKGQNHGGRRAYGYTLDGLETIPVEAAEVARMFEQFLAGVPLGAIVRDLNTRAVPTYTGAAWTTSTVRGMLLRARYAGLREYQGELLLRDGVPTAGLWPAIVSEDTWRATRALLEDPARRKSTGNRAAYLLSGLAFCGVCGKNITSAGLKRSSKIGTRRQYKCRSGAHVNRRQDWIDDYVSEVVIERLSRPDASELLVDHSRPDLGALRAEAQVLRVRLDEAAVAFADGVLTGAQLRTATERLRSRLAEIEEQQSHASRAPILSGLVSAGNVRAAWNGLPLDRRRAVVAALLRVTLFPGGGGVRTFDRSKVGVEWL